MQQTFTRIIFSISCPRGPKRFSVVLYQDCLDFKSQGTKIKNKNKIPETIGWYGILQNSAYILPFHVEETATSTQLTPLSETVELQNFGTFHGRLPFKGSTKT
jgi:hypothetical protein